MPRNPDKRPCTYPGCRAWAMRDSDPPYCYPHARLLSAAASGPPLPDLADEYRPSFSVPGPPQGAPSRDKPSLGKAPSASPGAPLGNQNRVFHGFYRRTLDPEEAGEVAEYLDDFDIHGHRLDSEILIGRVALRRILAMLRTGTTLGDNPKPRACVPSPALSPSSSSSATTTSSSGPSTRPSTNSPKNGASSYDPQPPSLSLSPPSISDIQSPSFPDYSHV
jgi:hypothetical protein